jgi:hypothetical protein
MIYNNNMRLPPRLPKLESEAKPTEKSAARKKFASYDNSTMENYDTKEPETVPLPNTPKKKHKKSSQSLITNWATRTKAGCQANKNPKTN